MERYTDELINEINATIDDLELIGLYDGITSDKYWELDEQLDYAIKELAQYPRMPKSSELARVQAWEVVRYLQWVNHNNLGYDDMVDGANYLIDGFMSDDPKFKQEVITTFSELYEDDIMLKTVVKEFALNDQVKVTKLL